MTWWKIVAYVFAAILIILGVLWILGANSATGGGGSQLLVGVVMVLIGFVAIYFAARKTAADKTNVTVKIDLPGNVSMDTLKCKSCGGTITKDDISLVNGAPVVTCPYCHTTYQLTEEPKW